MQRIVESQSGFGGLAWNVFTPVGLFAFVLFFTASLAEGERTPFDIPEADSEIVAGYMTEYTGMKFGLFYAGELLHAFTFGAFIGILFFGGWSFFDAFEKSPPLVGHCAGIALVLRLHLFDVGRVRGIQKRRAQKGLIKRLS